MSTTKRNKLFAPLLLCVAALMALVLAMPTRAIAEKCNPRDPETCVGGPTDHCGGQYEACCGGSWCQGSQACWQGTCIPVINF